MVIFVSDGLMNLEKVVYNAKSVDDKEFISEIFIYAEPNYTVYDLNNLKIDIKNEIKKLPDISEEMNAISKDEFNKKCNAKIDKLIDNIEKNGYKNLGEASTIDAFEEIIDYKLVIWDGNDREIWFETKDYYFHFYANTS